MYWWRQGRAVECQHGRLDATTGDRLPVDLTPLTCSHRGSKYLLVALCGIPSFLSLSLALTSESWATTVIHGRRVADAILGSSSTGRSEATSLRSKPSAFGSEGWKMPVRGGQEEEKS